MNFRVLLLAVVVMAAGMSSVEAGVIYTFSYELDGGDILYGKLDGVLQGDNDTVVVNSVSDLSFAGVPAGSFPLLDSFSNVVAFSSLSPVVSISGSTMDIIVTDSPLGVDGFLFEASGAFSGFPVYSGGTTFGNVGENFDSARWTLTSTAAVPEPTSIGILTVGALGMMFARRKKRLKLLAS